jgi:hypothetical protein
MSDSVMDNGVPLLLKKLDQLLFGADVARDAPVNLSEEANYRSLLV